MNFTKQKKTGKSITWNLDSNSTHGFRREKRTDRSARVPAPQVFSTVYGRYKSKRLANKSHHHTRKFFS